MARLRKLLLILFFLPLMATVSCGPRGGSDSADAGAADTGLHRMGSLSAHHYPSIIGGYAADHTYLTGVDEAGTTYGWSCFSSASGGDPLAGTETTDDVDLTVVEFMADRDPCKWPLGYYLRVGICHQCANRGLYYTGKTVSQAPGYTFFVSLYGTYGSDAYPLYTMDNCLDAAPPWRGGAFRAAPETLAMSMDDGGPGATSEEVALYHAYFGSEADDLRRGANTDDRFRDYLDALFALKVEQRLGVDFPEETLFLLQDARNDFLDALADLNARLPFPDEDAAAWTDAYQIIIDALDRRYRALLSRAQYEQLFNMDYDASPFALAQPDPS